MERKNYMLSKLLRDYELLLNKVNFIKAIISGDLKINKVKKEKILTDM